MFRSAIIKLTARCNLSCTYCYMFNLGDATFTRVPPMMSIPTALRSLERIADHCREHSIREFDVVLHGGEPTLWPLASFERMFARAEELRSEGIGLSLTMQTNGLRLDVPLLRLLDRYSCSIGISLDGPEFVNDRNRITRGGRGSYRRIIENVEALYDKGYGHLIGGFLSVAQPEISPREFLDWAAELPKKRIDVLWPMHFNYANPPWGALPVEQYARHPTYGVWFADVFMEWFARDDSELFVRSFYDVIGVIMGAKRHGDSIVNDVLDMFVINTDGGIEYHDYFRPLTDGATRTGFHVDQNSLDEIAKDDVFTFALSLGQHLPAECRDCPVEHICGGGFLPGRLEPNTRIPRRRSVLCFDEYYFFTTVKAVVERQFEREREHSTDSEAAVLA